MTRPGLRTVFLDGILLPARIGVYVAEQRAPQRIRVGVEFDVVDPGGVGEDTLARAVDYATVHRGVLEEVAAGHVRLVETLAERIAARAMADERVVAVRVRVDKLDVFPDGAIAGVLVRRSRDFVP